MVKLEHVLEKKIQGYLLKLENKNAYFTQWRHEVFSCFFSSFFIITVFDLLYKENIIIWEKMRKENRGENTLKCVLFPHLFPMFSHRVRSDVLIFNIFNVPLYSDISDFAGSCSKRVDAKMGKPHNSHRSSPEKFGVF